MKDCPANNLKKYRIAAGRTQDEVAAAAQVDPKSLYRYENGRQCPNVYTALRLAEYLGITVNELFPLETSDHD